MQERAGVVIENFSTKSATTDTSVAGSIRSVLGVPNNRPYLSFDDNDRISLGNIATPSEVTITVWIRTTQAGQRPVFNNRGSGS